MTRRGWDDEVRGASEAVRVLDAHAHVGVRVYFTFDEKTRGPIEPGKWPTSVTERRYAKRLIGFAPATFA